MTDAPPMMPDCKLDVTGAAGIRYSGWLGDIERPDLIRFNYARREYEEWCSGKSYAEIGRSIGITGCRVRQRISRFVMEANKRMNYERKLRELGIPVT